jgi:hypothetical protein
MKFSAVALAAVCIVSLSSSVEGAAFVNSKQIGVGNKASKFVSAQKRSFQPRASLSSRSSSVLQMGYTVAIVGATGAVGKEIRNCLEDRGVLPVDKLRIFGSERSAGSKVDTKFGVVEVELFDVTKARECDVVFLAVSGDFSLEHAEAITAGDDGAVVIDNSVRWRWPDWFSTCACCAGLFISPCPFLAVCLSLQTRNPLGCARNQRCRNQEIQVDCQP